MVRAIIGITTAWEDTTAASDDSREPERHAELLERAGACAMILPRGLLYPRAVEREGLSGLLFSGGGNLTSALYDGHDGLSIGKLDPTRDTDELTLMRHAFARRIPTLGVCRGMQVVLAPR